MIKMGMAGQWNQIDPMPENRLMKKRMATTVKTDRDRPRQPGEPVRKG